MQTFFAHDIKYVIFVYMLNCSKLL